MVTQYFMSPCVHYINITEIETLITHFLVFNQFFDLEILKQQETHFREVRRLTLIQIIPEPPVIISTGCRLYFYLT